MEVLFQATLAVLLGFIVTLQTFNWVTQWLWGAWTQAKPQAGTRSTVALLAALLLVPGPWALAILIALALKFKEAWWAVWVGVGAAAGALFLAVTIVRVLREARERDANEHAS